MAGGPKGKKKKSKIDEAIEALIRFLKWLFGANQKLIDKLKKLADDNEKMAQDLLERAKDLPPEARQKQIDIANEFLEKAKKLREEIKRLLGLEGLTSSLGDAFEQGVTLLAAAQARASVEAAGSAQRVARARRRLEREISA